MNIYLNLILLDPKIDLVGKYVKELSFNLGEIEFFEELNVK